MNFGGADPGNVLVILSHISLSLSSLKHDAALRSITRMPETCEALSTANSSDADSCYANWVRFGGGGSAIGSRSARRMSEEGP